MMSASRVRWLYLVAAAALLVPSAARSQISVTIRGRIVDARTQGPIEGVFVAAFRDDRGVLSDSSGFFALTMAPSPSYTVTAEGLGYGATHFELPESAPEELTILALRPDPIQLQGLTVLVDRFESRRRQYYGSVRVLNASVLQRRGGGQSARDLLRREVPFARPCSGEPWNLCTSRRGGTTRVRLCVDERPAWGGMEDLDAYDTGELYLVEVYGRGEQVRVYTRWYVEKLLTRGETLRPLGWTC